LRHVFSPPKDEAWQAADAEYRRVNRGAASKNVTLAVGNPSIIPEPPIKLQGWKKGIV